jgi:hypothetical protein
LQLRYVSDRVFVLPKRILEGIFWYMFPKAHCVSFQKLI